MVRDSVTVWWYYGGQFIYDVEEGKEVYEGGVFGLGQAGIETFTLKRMQEEMHTDTQIPGEKLNFWVGIKCRSPRKKKYLITDDEVLRSCLRNSIQVGAINVWVTCKPGVEWMSAQLSRQRKRPRRLQSNVIVKEEVGANEDTRETHSLEEMGVEQHVGNDHQTFDYTGINEDRCEGNMEEGWYEVEDDMQMGAKGQAEGDI